MGDEKIQSFEDLDSWQKSINFAVTIYNLTGGFPKSEQFGITNQLRRASSGISANIAEGFGRRGAKEKTQFYQIAYGSLLEVKSFLYLCEKLNYIDSVTLANITSEITVLQKMINASVRTLRNST